MDKNTEYKRPQHKVKWTVTQSLMDSNTNYNGLQHKV